MTKLVYVPPPDPIPHAIPLMVAGAKLAFQLGRIGIHILRGPGAVAEGHSHVLPLLLMPVLVGAVAVGAMKLWGRKVSLRIREPRITRVRFGGRLILIGAVFGVIGRQVGLANIRALRPMVLIDNQRVVKSAAMPLGNDSTVPQRLLIGPTGRDTLTLGGRVVTMAKDSASLTIAEQDGTRRLTVPLPALGMPQQVEVVPIRATAPEPVAFAVLVTGSPTSNQAMFAVADSSWRLVYLERMYQRWPAASRMLTLQRDTVTSLDVVIVARNELTKRMYRLAAQ